jgi:tetratricopeptide (TPR) repeat protein
MLGVLARLVLACAVIAPACVSDGRQVKHGKQAKHDERALLKDAQEDARNGDYEASDKAFDEAYQISHDFEVVEDRVDMLIHAAGKATRAVEVAKAYYDDNIKDVRGFNLYAEALLAAGNGAEALNVAVEIVKLNGDDPAGHEKRGRALILLDKNDEGVDELRKARDLDSKSSTYQMALGTALLQLKHIDEAAVAFHAAIKAAPDDADAYVQLGAARRQQQELDDAKGYLDKAIELDPRNGTAHFELGLLYNAQGKQAEAEAELLRSVQLAPNNSLFWYATGEIYRVQERFDEAINAYKKAGEIDPPYPKALQKLGLMLVERKQYDAAEVVLTRAIRREPNIATNYLNLGTVYAAKGRTRAAIDNIETYLKKAPKNDADLERARATLDKLRHRKS